jgi:hypothetical protein
MEWKYESPDDQSDVYEKVVLYKGKEKLGYFSLARNIDMRVIPDKVVATITISSIPASSFFRAVSVSPGLTKTDKADLEALISKFARKMDFTVNNKKTEMYGLK